MHVVIRLQNHGCKNHPFWWIVVSPKKRNIKGRFIEHIGYWIPHERKVVQRSVILNKPRIRHWLAMGAQVTPKIHRFLSWIDLLPAPLIKYGSKTVYDKPIAPIPRSTIKNFNRPLGGIFDTFYLDKISQNLVNNDLKRKIFYQQTKADEIPQTSEELEQSWNKLRAELYQIENDNKSANPLKREKLFEKINKIASDWYDEKQLEGLKQISLEKSKIKVDSKNLKEQIMIQNLAIETEQQLKSKINWLKELTPMTKEEAYTFINQQMNYPQKSEEILKEAFDYAHKTSQVVSKVMIEDFIRRKYTKFTVIADENHSISLNLYIIYLQADLFILYQILINIILKNIQTQERIKNNSLKIKLTAFLMFIQNQIKKKLFLMKTQKVMLKIWEVERLLLEALFPQVEDQDMPKEQKNKDLSQQESELCKFNKINKMQKCHQNKQFNKYQKEHNFMLSLSSLVFPESYSISNTLLLNLAAPPENLTPEYFSSLLSQYGAVQHVKIINQTLMDCRVLVEMKNYEAAKQAKQALDEFSSNFIKCSFHIEEKTIQCEQNTIGSLETIIDTTQSTVKNRLTTSLNEIILDTDSKPPSISVLPLSLKQIQSQKNLQPTRTLFLSGVQGNNINALKLYNIFSNFGNIDKIIIIRLKSFALIKYLKNDYSTFVFQKCQNIQFFDCNLTISFASDDAIDKLVGLDTLYHEDDYYEGSQQTDRFNGNNKMVQWPPSQILHISNLKKISSNAETMWDVFSEFGVVEAVKVLNSPFKFMCLMKMESLKQALEVMALMHNEEIDGRNIQISFTTAKI